METVEAINLFDEYNRLRAENNRLREENYDLTLTFLLLKEKNAEEIVKLRGVLQQITELSPFKLWPGHASLKFFAEMPREQEISFCSVRLIEITTLAHEALKEKE